MILLAAQVASAESTMQPRAHVQEVSDEICVFAAGDIAISCDADDCLMTWTPKPGRVAVFTDWNAPGKNILDELAAIEAKDDAGITLTAAEQRRFRKIVKKLLTLGKRL